MKIIDLLNKIANGEEPPKKILFKESVFEYGLAQGDYYSYDAKEWLFDEYDLITILNEPIEILEITIKNCDSITCKDNKIEKLDISNGKSVDMWEMFCKINEIIDKVNNER